MRVERIREMENYIGTRQVVTIPELCKKFKVSVNTVRRDLNVLENRDAIKKIYGGAQKKDRSDMQSDILSTYTDRNVINAREKERVAKCAASLVRENEVIFIDTGTSTVPMLKYLSSVPHLTIVTNSVYILHSCLEFPQFTAIGLPGMLKHKTASLVGDECLRSMNAYNIHTAFMAASAFSIEDGASNSSLEEFAIKKKVLLQSERHVLLLDSGKLDRSSLASFARADEFHAIILDKEPPKRYLQYCSEKQIDLLIAAR